MVKDVYYGKTLRKSFARHEEVLDMPNLLEIQKKSYQWFLDTGLQEVFRDVAAIGDYAGNLELSFIDFTMDEKPKYSVEECKARDATYAAPLKVRVRQGGHLCHQWGGARHRLPDRPFPRRLLCPQCRQGRQHHLCRNGHPLPGRLAGV